MFGFEPHGADPWRRERLIRVRCDHRQPLSTFVSEKPTFIAWPATNHAGSRPDAKRRSPLPEAKRCVRVFSCRHDGHQALVQSTREGATSSTFEQWGAGAVAQHRDDDVFVVWLVGRRHIRNPGEMSEAASMTHAQPGSEPIWLRHFPPVLWLREYRTSWLGSDIVAGVTLAAYAIPVALAYAELAALPPQVGVYGYMLGGLGYALLGSSRQLAIGPTSAISLMVAGAVGAMADGNALRYVQIASLAAFTVAIFCLIGWLLRLSVLVRLISDSILVGFKAGAGLTIIMSQLPSLIGVSGGGHHFFERAALLASQLGQTQSVVLAVSIAAIVLLLLGDYLLPARPVPLAV